LMHVKTVTNLTIPTIQSLEMWYLIGSFGCGVSRGFIQSKKPWAQMTSSSKILSGIYKMLFNLPRKKLHP
jgi:hypothetical protein